MFRETAKAKTAAKTITYQSEQLKNIVLETLNKVSNLVGSTLGPNGKVVLIERQENLPPFLTKDGITVFNAIAFSDPTAQAVLEAARDSSSKTNIESGDGPQPLYSKILTPNGFIQMGEIKEGMQISGTNGTTQTVLGVFEKGEKEIYEVEFADGEVVECSSDHLWAVSFNRVARKNKTTASLLEDYKKPTPSGHNRYKYYTPKTFVEFQENKESMPLDPYLIGLLLGDGSLSGTGSIELSLGKNKEHILTKLILPDGIVATPTFVSDKNYYRVKITGVTSKGESMYDLVRSVGLLGSLSNTKFIPKQYLFASKQTRERVLQGLLDTDGYINSRGRFEFSTVSDSLRDDFLFLIRSLGKSAFHYTMKRKLNSSYSSTPIHRISELQGYKRGHKIVRITPTQQKTKMRCIKVSNPDHLYITDNFIVTHNTTTATILAESLIKLGFEYLEKNPQLSTQKVIRELESTYNNFVAPFVKSVSTKISTKNSDDLLKKVAMIATNSDEEMSSSVIEAFSLVGHNGNITIEEAPGTSGFQVEKIEGLPIARGFEDSCGRFLEEFINDKGNYRTVLERPRFILYHGQLTEPSRLIPILQKAADASGLYESDQGEKRNVSPNIVIVAHHFSEAVLAFLAQNFKNPETLNLLPLKTVMTQQTNSPYHFLNDLAAYTGATVFDPLTNPLEEGSSQDMGTAQMERIEVYRYRSVLFGKPDEFLLISRAEELGNQAKQAESSLDAEILRERMALLTGGLARVKVLGSSESELKEKKHRVEDAVMAIKGALKDGVLPGCGKTLLTLSLGISKNPDTSDAVKAILCRAFTEPFHRILTNGGSNSDEVSEVYKKIMSEDQPFWNTYDALNHKFGDAVKLGVIDSSAAVLMAIKNSLSVAKMLMGLSGIVVFKRDMDVEVGEAKNYSAERAAMAEALKEQEKEKWEVPI